MELNFETFIILLVIIIICYNLYNLNKEYTIVNIGDDQTLEYNKKLKSHEKKLRNWYPLGPDKFYLDHGKDYCQFFRRLGQLEMHICVNKKKDIVGTCAMILRNIPNEMELDNSNSDSYEKVWYLSDLKIEKDFRGKHIPSQFITKNFIGKYLKSNKAYGITMDDKKNTRIVDICNKNSYMNMFKLSPVGKLYLYTVDYELMQLLHTVLNSNRGRIGYISLKGIKDLILKSTKNTMPLLHVQWGKFGTFEGENTFDYPMEGYSHMFCLYETDPLKQMLDNLNIMTDVTATIVQYNMEDINWDFVLTSDI